jgi:8-oxo-dGTP pyrophosphatase MutT (NUDIX family)
LETRPTDGVSVNSLFRKSRTYPAVPILAAGGVLLGTDAKLGQIAVVRRRRYACEMGLPKGKLKNGENVPDAALREVREETGCEAKIREYAGSTHYLVRGVPKVVFYFLMEVECDNGTGPLDRGEVEAVEWMTPESAVAALTHPEDQALISAVFGLSALRR